MKSKISKTLLTAIAVILALSVFCVSVSAVEVKNEKAGLVAYLSDIDNTGFDFEDTSMFDTNICWTVFALSKAGAKNVYPEYETYINDVVSKNYDSMFPANFALIYITALERGQNAENIGGKNILSALKSADYASQTYLSSLYFPLLALNYNDVKGVDSVEQTIIETILASQQSDGGFPYCSVDTGYGITSDTDTTSFVIQALAMYKENSQVKTALENAVAYLDTQKFDDGSYGYTAWTSKSVESTAQALIAMTAMGEDMDSAANAIKTYIDSQTGAAINSYSGLPDTMSSYQALIGLVQYDNFKNNKDFIYKLYVEPETTTNKKVDDVTSTTEDEKEITTNKNSVEIPKTGSREMSVIGVSVFAVCSGVALAVKKKHEEI